MRGEGGREEAGEKETYQVEKTESIYQTTVGRRLNEPSGLAVRAVWILFIATGEPAHILKKTSDTSEFGGSLIWKHFLLKTAYRNQIQRLALGVTTADKRLEVEKCCFDGSPADIPGWYPC